MSFPPQAEHKLVVICNGGPLARETGLLFDLVNAQFFARKNDPGYDITAYQDIVGSMRPDLLVACGETIYFHKSGWLKRYVDEWTRFGPGMYGTFASNLVRQHLNTTGFAITPKFLINSPRPQNKKERYEFEHGNNSIWRRVSKLGFPTKLVTWDGAYDPDEWRNPPNILWRGDQSNCLMFCSHTDRYRDTDAPTRKRWGLGADHGGRMT